MRLPGSKKRFLFFSIVISAGYLYTSAVAQDTTESKANAAVEQSTTAESTPAEPPPEKSTPVEPTPTVTTPETKLFGGGGTISYVAPYMWRGLRHTSSKGPCKGPFLQYDFWISVWQLRLGAFINMFGSNKDRGWKKGSNSTIVNLDTGVCSQSFGMIDQVNFRLDWKHNFNKTFSLYTAYTQYAYAEYYGYTDTTTTKKYYDWFNKNTTWGEFTIKPSFQIGIFTLFTEQNFVIIAPDRSFLFYTAINDTVSGWVVLEDTRRGNYHSAYGVSIEKKVSDKFTFGIIIQEEIANRNFFETYYRDPVNGWTVSTGGLYQRTVTIMTRYSPWQWFSFRANYGAEFITNQKINSKEGLGGAMLFGSVNAVFTW